MRTVFKIIITIIVFIIVSFIVFFRVYGHYAIKGAEREIDNFIYEISDDQSSFEKYKIIILKNDDFVIIKKDFSKFYKIEIKDLMGNTVFAHVTFKSGAQYGFVVVRKSVQNNGYTNVFIIKSVKKLNTPP